MRISALKKRWFLVLKNLNRYSIQEKRYKGALNQRTNHRFCYSIFRRRFEFLNEITIVKTVEKTWSTFLRIGKLIPVPKKSQIYTLLTWLHICLKLCHELNKHLFFFGGRGWGSQTSCKKYTFTLLLLW